MTILTFNDTAEFIAEVTRRLLHVRDGTIRITNQYRLSSQCPIRYLSVVATCVIEEDLCRLEKEIGEYHGSDHERAQTLLACAARIQDELVGSLPKSLTIAAGVLSLP